MKDRARFLASNLVSLAEFRRDRRRRHALSVDPTVAARMGTKKSVVSRLESGLRTRPTLRTIERYALAVGASVDIRVRSAQ